MSIVIHTDQYNHWPNHFSSNHIVNLNRFHFIEQSWYTSTRPRHHGDRRCLGCQIGARPSATTMLTRQWLHCRISHRDQSSYAPSQWETSLHCNDGSHWLGAYLDRSLEGGWQLVGFFRLLTAKTRHGLMKKNNTHDITCVYPTGDGLCNNCFDNNFSHIHIKKYTCPNLSILSICLKVLFFPTYKHKRDLECHLVDKRMWMWPGTCGRGRRREKNGDVWNLENLKNNPILVLGELSLTPGRCSAHG